MTQPDEMLDELLAETPDVTARGQEFVRDGRAFAARAAAGGIEVCLGADIADPAMRTPDTHSSARGADWVLFTPREWDDHAKDRLEAWFRVAWRRAGDRR